MHFVEKSERKSSKLYQKVAELGSAAALNDVGTSHATGYAGLTPSFDKSAKFYVRAIQAGCAEAISNLGTHYETGMKGGAQNRIDISKAVYYYKADTKLSCQICTYYLAMAYEEGFEGVLTQSVPMANQLYRRALLICDDENDMETTSRIIKDLAAMHITRLKISDPGSEEAQRNTESLASFLTDNITQDAVIEVEKALLNDVNGGSSLAGLIGVENAARLIKRAKPLARAERNRIAAAMANGSLAANRRTG